MVTSVLQTAAGRMILQSQTTYGQGRIEGPPLIPELMVAFCIFQQNFGLNR